jgi:type VI secretion system protein ImpH
MAKQRPQSVLERLQQSPHRFDAFKALELAASSLNDDGRLRAVETITNRLVAAPIVAVRDVGDGTLEVEQAMVGILGPTGPMPPSYTEAALAARKRRSPSLAAFLNIFVHRCVLLLKRSIEKYRLPARVASGATPGTDGLLSALFALIGLGLPSLRGRLAMADTDLLPYAGLLASSHRSAAGLAVLLADRLQLPVRVESFSGRWVLVGADEQTALDALRPRFARLGVDAVAGARLWDVQGAFRIIIGPLDYQQFRALAPDQERMRQVVDFVRLYAGPELSFDVQLILAKEEIPACRLTDSPRLGWNTWAIGVPALADSTDSVYDPDQAA